MAGPANTLLLLQYERLSHPSLCCLMEICVHSRVATGLPITSKLEA